MRTLRLVVIAIVAVEVGLLLARYIIPDVLGNTLGMLGWALASTGGLFVVPAAALWTVLTLRGWRRAGRATLALLAVAALLVYWDIAALNHRAEVLHAAMGLAAGTIVFLIDWIDSDPDRPTWAEVSPPESPRAPR